MKTISQLYKNLKAQPGTHYEVNVVRGQTVYGMDKLVSVEIFPSISGGLKGITIGNACSAECDLRLREDSANWERMAQFSVRVRLVSETQQSEWLQMGTFYTDERSEDEFGNLTIVAYDAMLQTERFWTDLIPDSSMPATFPITAKAFCDLLEGQNLIQVDSRTTLDNLVAFVGLDTASTIRDKLRDIAAAHGGNWVMTPENKLRLIPFVNAIDGSAAIAGIAIAGISVVGDSTYNTGTNADYIFLGMNVERVETSPALPPISGVVLESESGNTASSGSNIGYTLKGNCNFATTEGVATICLNRTSGYVYKPFTATNALLDPAADIGDLVIINGISYQLMDVHWNLNVGCVADISAPVDAEVDHEYTIIPKETKQYRKTMDTIDGELDDYARKDQFSTLIQQNEQSVVIAASHTYVTIADNNAAIQNLQDQIDGRITKYSGDEDPTLNNYPANQWITDTQKAQNIGSLYLVNDTSTSPHAGMYYRFESDGVNYAWILLDDNSLAEALEAAAAAQAAAEQASQDVADAVVAAAADATAKANQALQDAKAYSDQKVNEFISGEYQDDLDAIASQLDQKAETYYQAEDPSTGWDNPAEHIGDLWYDTVNQIYLRWNGESWEETPSNPPQGVFDKIDGKAQIFISEPVPPYRAGDLWVQGENGDILKCRYGINRVAGEPFVDSDWLLASKYTDDSALFAFINGEFADALNAISTQIDQKAETFYQADDPAFDGTKPRWDARVSDNTPQHPPGAIAGLTIVGSTNQLHEGDLWYKTGNDTTYYWGHENGEWKWIPQTIPVALFDRFDGKARVFTSTPFVPYKEGDLWVQGETGDILKCKDGVDKESESEQYDPADWELASKYTDDTSLNAYKTTVTAQFTAQGEEIAAKVTKTGGNNVIGSFAWALNDTGHRWYANGSQTPVVSITASGLSVVGDVTAKTGFIGNGSNGFTISATAIYNGMTSFNDTEHNGIYIGTDGISLGGGRFKVDSAGNITASSGTFTGSIYASNIKSDGVDGYGGSFNSRGISAGGNFSSSYMNSNVQGALTSAIGYGNATLSLGTDNSPTNFTAKNIDAIVAFYGGSYRVQEQGSVSYDLTAHYHSFTERDGKIYMSAPTGDSAHANFNIADTTYFKDRYVRSVSATRRTSDAQIVFNSTNITVSADYDLIAKNGNSPAGTIYTEQEYPITIPAAKAFNAGAQTAYVSAINVGTSGSPTYVSEEARWYADASITATPRGTKADGTYIYPGNRTLSKSIDVTATYNAGKTAGAQTMVFSTITATATGQPSYSSEDNVYYANSVLAARGRTTKGDGTVYYVDKSQQTAIDVTNSVLYGRTLVGIGSVTQNSYSTSADFSVAFDNSYLRYSNGYINGRALISLSNSSVTKNVYIQMDGQRAYNAGVDTGAASGTVSALSVGEASEPNYDSESGRWYSTATAVATPRATYSTGAANNPNVTFTNRTINVTAAYNKGKAAGIREGELDVTITDLHATSLSESLPAPDYDSYYERYISYVRIAASLSSEVNGRWTTTAVNVTDIYNAGWSAGEAYAYDHMPDPGYYINMGPVSWNMERRRYETYVTSNAGTIRIYSESNGMMHEY